MTTVWRVSLDRTRCIGSGICAGTAPQQFRLADGLSESRHEFIDPDRAIVDAAESCPTEAITVLDRDTGQVIAPR